MSVGWHEVEALAPGVTVEVIWATGPVPLHAAARLGKVHLVTKASSGERLRCDGAAAVPTVLRQPQRRALHALREGSTVRVLADKVVCLDDPAELRARMLFDDLLDLGYGIAVATERVKDSVPAPLGDDFYAWLDGSLFTT